MILIDNWFFWKKGTADTAEVIDDPITEDMEVIICRKYRDRVMYSIGRLLMTPTIYFRLWWLPRTSRWLRRFVLQTRFYITIWLIGWLIEKNRVRRLWLWQIIHQINFHTINSHHCYKLILSSNSNFYEK